MKPSEILLSARDLIAVPGGFSQGAFARDASGAVVGSFHPHAVAMCMVGAIRRFGSSDDAHALLGRVTVESPARFNDTHTQAECVDVMGRAAELAISEGQ